MKDQDINYSSVEKNFVIAFPEVVDLYFEKRYKQPTERNFDILNKRFALTGANVYTLEDIGTFYDLTRERVRQIESKAISELNLLLRGKLKTKGWSIASPLCTEYAELSSLIENSSLLILEEQIDSVFLYRYNEKLSPGYRELFMEMAGFSKVPQSVDGFRGDIKNSWHKLDRNSSNEIVQVFRALDVIFDNPAIPLSLFDLTIKAKKSAKDKISNESLQIAISACSNLELANDQIRVQLHALGSAADKAYRILDTSKKSMHYSAIAREINFSQNTLSTFRPVKEANLKNQLVSDNRFVAIGRSGEWGLSQWKYLNTGTIISSISNILHKNGAPMKLAEIVFAVKHIRPDASPKSISVYLHQSDLFSRIGRSEYALSSWRLPKADISGRAGAVDTSAIVSAVEAYLGKSSSAPFPGLIQFIRNETGLSAVSARQRLLKLPFLDVRPVSGQRYKTAYLVDSIEDSSRHQSKRILLRKLVQDEAKAILRDHPNEPFKKGDLYIEVCKSVKCGRPTFYKYLSETKDIRQYNEGNVYFAIFDHKESLRNIDIDIKQYSTDPALLKELQRPLSKLTVEEIDIALFEFGVLFENKLREFLQAAKNGGQLNISAKDMSRLVANMVNCAVREGVVTKGHHLNTLREERNKRAHGNIPSLQERQVLFNKAHYVADLFVEYISFFHEKKISIEI